MADKTRGKGTEPEAMEPEAGAAVALGAEDGVSVLTLRGPVNIFEAGTLLQAARQALATAGPVRVDLSRAERLDLSAWQILCALSRDVRAAGSPFAVDGASPPLARASADAGLTL